MERPDTPAQVYAALAGAFLLALGVLSLVFTDVDFEGAGLAAEEPEFLIWPVNGWTAVFWTALGALGLLSVPRLALARVYAIGAGLLFAVVAVWGLVDSETVAGLLVAAPADNVTHAVLAVLGLLFGVLPRDAQRPETDITQERRFERDTSADRAPTASHR
jgi:hypothetical protein